MKTKLEVEKLLCENFVKYEREEYEKYAKGIAYGKQVFFIINYSIKTVEILVANNISFKYVPEGKQIEIMYDEDFIDLNNYF